MLVATALLCFVGCERGGNSAKYDVVASFGNEDLTRAQLDFFLPQGVEGEDSSRLSRAYIEEWIRMQAISEQAEQKISSLDDKLEYRLQNYRSQLMAHEYAAWLMAPGRMDTAVSETEVRNYYQQFPDKFISRANHYQYFHIRTDLPNQYRAVTLMQGDEPTQIEELREWAAENATEYKLDSTYVGDMQLDLATEGYNHGDIKRRPFMNQVVPYNHREEGTQYFNYIKMIDVIKPGDPLPLDMCRDRIRSIILNRRKNELLEQHAQQLVEAARSSNKVKIYE